MSGKRARRDRRAAYLAQPYIRKLNEAIAAGEIPSGMLVVGVVIHEDDCPLLKGGLCTCHPSLEFRHLPRDAGR